MTANCVASGSLAFAFALRWEVLIVSQICIIIILLCVLMF